MSTRPIQPDLKKALKRLCLGKIAETLPERVALTDRSPMPQVLDYLASPHTRPADAATLAASLVALGYRDIVLPEKRRLNLVSVAEAVGRRLEGTQAVALMQLALPRRFGLDALGQLDAVQTFAAWKVTFDRRFRAP